MRGGRIRDHGLRGLIGQLADQNAGLCVIASRQEIVELGDRPEPMVRRTDLSDLSPLAGRQLLESLGVRGDPRLIAGAAEAAGGHALTLNLLGSYVAGVHGGVIEEAKAAVADLVAHGTLSGHDRAARMMEGYVRRFEALGAAGGAGAGGAGSHSAVDGGQPELALLHLVGLFDRPAEKDAIAVVKAAGLGAPLAALGAMTPQRWSTAVSRLRAQRLLLPRDPARPYDLDAHPLVRAHFGARLKRVAPEVFRAAHLALYEHYKLLGLPAEFRTPEAYGTLLYKVEQPEGPLERRVRESIEGQLSEENAPYVAPIFWSANPERMREAAKLIGTPAFHAGLEKFLPGDLAGMAPLFAAIAHGAAAGEQRAAYREVFWPRIRRGNEAYTSHKLGALSQDLAALAHFFAEPWSTPAQELPERDRALMLGEAAFSLRAQGRLRDAEEAYAAAVRAFKRLEGEERSVAINSGNLGEARLALGDVRGAVASAHEAVDHADRAEDAFQRITARTTLADALHQSGDHDGAAALFTEAERLQAGWQPGMPRLYSLAGYRYCDLLLAMGRAPDVRERYDYLVSIRQTGDSLLDRALEELLAGRAEHALASASHADPHRLAETRRTLDAAVDGLRRSGTEHHLPRGLLGRAACLRDMGEWAAAGRDLKETREIAERGEMRLFLTDWHLESARLLLAQLPRPAARTTGMLWWAKSVVEAPALNAEQREMRRQAEEHVQAAASLIEATGYHRRDGELADLRARLDAS
jgi:tetratricopeptide (TPR) repeat protein